MATVLGKLSSAAVAVALLLLVATSAVTAADENCPADADIAPCRCFSDQVDRLIMECYSLESDEQLASVFQQQFPVTELYNFYVDQSPGVTALSADVFNGVSFQIVEMYGTSLSTIDENAFSASFLTLERLVLRDTLLTEDTFPWLSIANFANLRVLSLLTSDVTELSPLTSSTLENFVLSDAKVTQVAGGTFQGLTSLTNINLEKNDITALQSGAFTDLPLLESLTLSENALTFIDAGTFVLPDAPMTVSVWNNNIDYFASGAFVLPSTTDSLSLFMDIGSNNLTILDEEVFGPVFPSIDFLFLAGNPFVCGCDIAWVITNPDWLGKLGNTAQCADGTYLVDLDAQYYTDNC